MKKTIITERMSKFYIFRQNNSGGRYEVDEKAGLGHFVLIEADDAIHANYLAGRKGIYFDGCATGDDCRCCGDRWDRASEWDASATPSLYGEPIENYDPWTDMILFIHRQDGTVVERIQLEKKQK